MTTYHDKRLATLTARAALAGVVLTATTDDHDNTVYVTTRWALTKTMPSLNAVEQWLDTFVEVQP